MSGVIGNKPKPTVEVDLSNISADSVRAALESKQETQEKIVDALAAVPPHLWAVYLAQDVVLYSRASRPNLIRRFFLWAFFGWRWKPIKKESK